MLNNLNNKLFSPESLMVVLFCLFINLPSFGQRPIKFRTNNKNFEHIARKQKTSRAQCGRGEFRTIDGTCNNISEGYRAKWGASDVSLTRMLAPVYGSSDPFNDMTGQDRLSPRAISNLVVTQTEDLPSKRKLSSFVFTWGQFLDHDISLTPEGHTEYDAIPLPEDEALFTNDIPFFRSKVHEGTGVTSPRQQSNLITSWIDASQVYGSERTRASWLRSFSNGKLKTSYGNLLPYNTVDGEYESEIDPTAPSMIGDNDGTGKTFVAGDVRAAEQPGLTSLHTLFVREHNRICDELLARGETDDERIYQMARKRVGAMIQAITYYEFLPALGVDLPKTSNYDRYTKPDISNVFASSAFRLGHTMVTRELLLIDNQCSDVGEGSISLIDGFFNTDFIKTYNIDPILKGLSIQLQQEVDPYVVDNLRNFLFAVPGSGTFGLDLASLNIQRGRDHGLPDYNTLRRHFTGRPARNFRDITKNHKLRKALRRAYDNDINNIDPWVGLLAEDHFKRKSVGRTLNKILRLQFLRLRDCDYYYFERDRYLPKKLKRQILRTNLSDIIERNSNLRGLPKNVFRADKCKKKTNTRTSSNESNNKQNGDNPHGELKVFPNPATQGFEIYLEEDNLKSVQLIIVDISGKTIFKDQDTSLYGFYQKKIDINNFARGIYVIRIQTNGGSYTKSLIVQ